MGIYRKADLLADVTGTYDQTKTTIQGRVFQKTIDGDSALGPPVSRFVDVFTDTALTPTGALDVTVNGRMFICCTVTTGILPILLYNFNSSTGVSTYVGRINVSLPNTATTTHTIRNIRIVDTGTTGWKIFLTSVGSVVINGGVFLVNDIDLADFAPIGFPTITFATGNDQKAVYFLQDPATLGVAHLNTASVGICLYQTGTKVYSVNGTAAVYQVYTYDYSIAPTYATQTCTAPTVAASPTFTLTGHGYSNNDQITFIADAPGGFSLVSNYFARNVSANTFELSATSGGASINATTVVTPTVGRAFGITGSNFSAKTGNLPALSGTLLLTGSVDCATPQHTTNSGSDCLFFATTTNLYLGQLSELTSGAVTWASLVTSNITGTINQITAPTTTITTWSDVLDAATYTTNTSIYVTKQVVNSVIRSQTGSLINTYYEGFTVDTAELGFVTVAGLAHSGGWIFSTGTTIGQRGVLTSDFRSDCFYDYSYIVTKVLDTPNSTLKAISSIEALFYETGNIHCSYRTSGFGSISGGWTQINLGEDLSTLSASPQIQFKIAFAMQSEQSSSPAQIKELLITLDSDNEISRYWEGSVANTDSDSPAKSAFRLKQAYESGTVPQMYFRAYDDSGVLVASANTVDDAADFEYSTNNGGSWNSLGTIPNTALTTELRYNWTTPPGVKVTISLREA